MIKKEKIKLIIDDKVTEPYFTGTKRIDPRDSLKTFIFSIFVLNFLEL